MAYGSEHTAPIPTVGVTEGEEFATLVNAALAEMRTTLNAKVTPAGIDMNADLSMRSGSTYYGVKDLHRLSLQQQATNLAAATYPAALYASAAGDLYFNDASGNQIALTSGGTIAGSVGSITGSGYGTSGVELNWDSGASDYHFYSAAATYADINIGALQLSDGSANQIRVEAPSIAADYTLTLPTAVPASTSLVQMSSGGALSTTRAPSIDTLTVGSTSTFTGKATFSVEYAHPQRTKHVLANECSSPSATLTTSSTSPHWDCTSSGQAISIPLNLTEGDRLEQIVIWVDVSATVYAGRTIEIGYWNNTVGVYTYPGGAYSSTSFVAGSGRIAITLNLTDITVSNPSGSGTGVGFLHARLTLGNGDEFWGARVQYSRQ